MVIYFINYCSKIFYCVRRRLLWKVLGEMGTPQHLLNVIKLIWEKQKYVKIKNEIASNFNTQRSDRAVYYCSIFIIHGVTENLSGGVFICSKRINNLRDADGTLLTAKDVQEMKAIATVDKIVQVVRFIDTFELN